MPDVKEFAPIDGDARDVTVLSENDRDAIANILIGRKVSKVDGEHLLLDDGTVIKAIGHDGCSCGSGFYDLAVLNGVDNIITRVEYDYRPADECQKPKFDENDPYAPSDGFTGYYRVYVYAENKRINLMQFNGSDGNGYYGTGFELLVRRASQ